ncbi:MAG: hypothetical protein AB4352_23430 [Hormoscilla sp.]
MTLVIDNVPSHVTKSDVIEYIEAKIGIKIHLNPIIADPSRKYPGSLYIYVDFMVNFGLVKPNFLVERYDFGSILEPYSEKQKRAARMIQGKYWGNQIVEAYYTTHEPNWKRWPDFIYPKSSQLWSPPSSSSPSSSSSSSKPSSSSSKPTGGQIAVGVLIGIGVITFLAVIMGFPVQIVITILGGIIGVAIAFNH